MNPSRKALERAEKRLDLLLSLLLMRDQTAVTMALITSASAAGYDGEQVVGLVHRMQQILDVAGRRADIDELVRRRS